MALWIRLAYHTYPRHKGIILCSKIHVGLALAASYLGETLQARQAQPSASCGRELTLPDLWRESGKWWLPIPLSVFKLRPSLQDSCSLPFRHTFTIQSIVHVKYDDNQGRSFPGPDSWECMPSLLHSVCHASELVDSGVFALWTKLVAYWWLLEGQAHQYHNIL